MSGRSETGSQARRNIVILFVLGTTIMSLVGWWLDNGAGSNALAVLLLGVTGIVAAGLIGRGQQ
ncbi:hypothetical protein [Arthrobacter sp. NtRootA1]|uniref:hypothetical protein n=1 Tax=Arthrobacter sp. NtRootA1 TaxID=2830983 RepID=UPI001CC6D8BB|nr:hypothetical protein [Arthrobacter sp. NtRootA1]BCW07707.1 hypothetical protein NtRootA1_38450 [Arthrobacter sp. NtRootA1]